ncbi:MAG TPA: AgmX/PglI C-terminal domain-containing protein [Kofleriaceae bacterium]|nr:AgmX/PglI C-terminal domain-containing protein [Kofleriaceae bacterium]
MRASLLLIFLAACGGATKPAPIVKQPDPPVAQADPDDEEENDDGLAVEGTKGHMDPKAIEAGVSPHQIELEGCFTSQVAKRRFLGGKVELKWMVDAEGALKSVQIATSDLGAWPVEKCLLDISRGMEFTKPKGGATDFSIPLEFSGKQSSTWWDADVGEEAAAKHKKDLAKCEKAGTRAPEDAMITAYVGARGKVVSVGFATTQESGLEPEAWDAWADCAEKRILAWQLPDPRGSIAKLAFHYP